MFKQLQNIDSAFKHIKLFSYLFLGCCALVAGFAVCKSYDFADKAQNSVRILYNGKVIQSELSDRRHVLPVELRDHIKTFHEDFFDLEPDDKQIQSSINQALYLADASAKRQYDDLRAKDYYANLVSGNISQRLTTDSIALDLNQIPYGFTYYGTEKLNRSGRTVVRQLVTHGKVRQLETETDNNPHGFLIEDWAVISNNDSDTTQ